MDRSSGKSVDVDPKMTREVNGPEGSPTHWASMGGSCSTSGDGGSTGFVSHTFLLRFSIAHRCSGAWAPLNILLCQSVQLVASCFQLLTLMFRSWREALM